MQLALAFAKPLLLPGKPLYTPRGVCKLNRRRPESIRVSRRRKRVSCCVEKHDWKRGPIDIDYEKDERLEVLEMQLDTALTEQDFKRAAQLRDDLMRLQSGSYVAVLSANLKFYNAFKAGSVVDMAGVWLQDSSVTCKHPLGPLLTGYVETINSFGYLFAMGVPSISVTNVRIMMRGSAAWVTCDENSYMVDEEGNSTEPKRENAGTEGTAVVMSATNIFVKRNGQWYLAHHTAQPIIGRELYSAQ